LRHRRGLSVAEKERHGEGENVAYEKRISLAKGRKQPANWEKGTRKQGGRYYLTRFRRPPLQIGRAPLRLGAPARLCWSGRQNPIFIPWFRLSLGSTANGGSHAPSTGVDAHPGRGCRDKPSRSRASARCRS